MPDEKNIPPKGQSAVTSGGLTGGLSSPAAYRAAFSMSALEVGTVLQERYEILALLGAGGMGAVYKARDRELDRMVALKVIRPDLAADPHALDRFKQELILARKVTHKNVVRIYDLGDAGGIRYITMDYLEGGDLASKLRERKKLPPDEATEIIRQVCRALNAAHSEGVIHRDLKPHNIFIENSGKVTVMDFGLARSLDTQNSLALTGLTQSGALVGTMKYMSPEQATGGELDARTDIYSLGLIFYELLTGTEPYKTESEVSSLVLRSHRPARPPAELEPSIPESLNAVVCKCLEIDRDRRYSSATEVLQDLEGRTGSRSGQSQVAPAALEKLRDAELRWHQKRAWWKPGAAAVLAVVLLGGIWLGWGRLASLVGSPAAAVQPVTLGVVPFHNASGDAALEWLGPTLAAMLEGQIGESARLWTLPTDRIDQALREVRVRPAAVLEAGGVRRLTETEGAEVIVTGQFFKVGEGFRVEASVLDTRRDQTVALQAESPNEAGLLDTVEQLAGQVRQALGFPAAAVQELEAAAFRPTTRILAAVRHYHEGMSLGRQGNHLEARQRFEAAVAADPAFALGHLRLAESVASLGFSAEAEQHARRAAGLSDGLRPRERFLVAAGRARLQNDAPAALEAYKNLLQVAPEDVDVHFALARLYENTGQFDLAQEHYTRVAGRDARHIEAQIGLGRVEVMRGNPAGALDPMNRALSLAIQQDQEQTKANILHALGIAYRELDKPEDALRYYNESLEIKRRLDDQRGIAAGLSESAQALARLGRLPESEASYLEALAIRRTIGDKRGLGHTLINLGNLYDDRGQDEKALETYREALQLQRELRNQNLEAMCLHNIGNIYLKRAQYDDALAYLERALALREQSAVPIELSETLYNLAQTYVKLGQGEQAEKQQQRALEIARGAGYKRGIALALHGSAELHLLQGRYGAALQAREESLHIAREIQEGGFWMAVNEIGYGQALAAAGRLADAVAPLDEGLKKAREVKNRSLVARALDAQGERAFYAGDLAAAQSAFQEAQQEAAAARDRYLVLQARLNLAKTAVRAGRGAQAATALRSLMQEAEPLGLRFLAAEASVWLGEALIAARNHKAAAQELTAALERTERLGLRPLTAQAHYLLSGLPDAPPAQAARHQSEAQRLLDEMAREARPANLSQRADLARILTR